VEIFVCERKSFFRMMAVATGMQSIFWLFAGEGFYRFFLFFWGGGREKGVPALLTAAHP